MPESKRFSLVTKAIGLASAQLARMPSSAEVDALRCAADEFEAETQAWAQQPPTDQERELMMKKALALQVAVTKLARPR